MSLKKLDTVGNPGAAYKVERMEGRISACGNATEMIIVLKVAFTHAFGKGLVLNSSFSAIDSKKRKQVKKENLRWSSGAKKRADFDLETTWKAAAVVRVNQCETGKPLLVMETAASLTLFIFFLFDMQISSKNGTIFTPFCSNSFFRPHIPRKNRYMVFEMSWELLD